MLAYTTVPGRRYGAPDKLRPRGHLACLLEEARRELPLRVYGRGDVMCNVGGLVCSTRPLFHPRYRDVRIGGINASDWLRI